MRVSDVFSVITALFLSLTSSLLSATSFCFLMSLSGDSDPDSRHGGNPGLVSADPREAAGPEHHGSGLQQYRSHAGRVLPCLQDRVLSFTSPAMLSPSHPLPPCHLLSLEVERELIASASSKLLALSWYQSQMHLLQPSIC